MQTSNASKPIRSSLRERPANFSVLSGDDAVTIPLIALGAGAGDRFAATFGGVDDTFVVVNGDVLTDLDISALIAFHRDHGSEATISLTPVDDPSVFGVVPTDANGKVEAFIEKPPRDEIPTNLINCRAPFTLHVFNFAGHGRAPPNIFMSCACVAVAIIL